MARIRTIKPEFWQDEKLAPLDAVTRLVFLGLISQADDAGRLVDSPRLIDGLLFPFSDETSATPLRSLADVGVIRRGRTASGQSIIQIVNWHHQKIDKPNLSGALPPIVEESPAFDDTSAKDRRNVGEASAPHISTGISTGTKDQLPGAAAPAVRTESEAQRLTNLVIDRGLNGVRPSDYGKQAAHAKRLLEKQPFDYWVGAAERMPSLFPYSEGEGWDVFDLGKKATKALASTRNGSGPAADDDDGFWTDPDGYI